jgi:hypothetical protein
MRIDATASTQAQDRQEPKRDQDSARGVHFCQMGNIEQIARHGSYHFSVSTNQLPAHFSAPGALCGKVVKNTRIAATLRVTPFHREEQRPTSCNSGMDPVFRYQEGGAVTAG